jgi:histidinol phosphatase-like enzyme
MLEQAIQDFQIDVARSVLYGDKPTDIEAGERCGIRSVLLSGEPPWPPAGVLRQFQTKESLRWTK